MAFERDALEKDIATTTRKAAEALRAAAAEPVTRLAEPVQRQSDALALYNAAMVSGFQTVWQEWLSMSQETIDRRMDAWSTLVRTGNPQTALAVQSQWLMDEIALAFNHGLRLSQTVTAVARGAAERAASR